MKYGSMFSGIEAATVAWHPLGWEPAWFAEIERFPSAVLKHHYPDVPNLGDVTKVDWNAVEPIELLVFGSPCQSFSVAGKRLGLDDPRGNLALYSLAVANQLRPRWFVFENVPGLLSSDGGRDFGRFLAAVGECGYQCAWRVLDAQHFGVPQRRRRVFVVGYLGDWRRAAAVLFERHSLQGHPAPSREAGERATAGTLRSTDGGSDGRHAQAGHLITADVAGTLGTHTGIEAQQAWTGRLVAHTLTQSYEASEDGTGRGTPLVPVLPFDTTQVTSKANRSNPKPGDPMHPLTAGAHPPAVAFSCKDHGADAGDVSPTLRSMNHDGSHANGGGQVAVALGFIPKAPAGVANIGEREEQSPTITTHMMGQGVQRGMAVRRITPREAERLQGFPDDYTLIPSKARKQIDADYFAYLRATYPEMSRADAERMAKDGPRYKALGNSMAVPCMVWLGQRIQMVEDLMREQEDQDAA